MNENDIIRVKLDPKSPSRGRTNWQRVKAMTDKEVERLAQTDPDCLPTPDEELKEFRPLI